MLFSISGLVAVLALNLSVQAGEYSFLWFCIHEGGLIGVCLLVAPVDHIFKRQTACFLPGRTALPAEVANGVPALVRAVTCTGGTSVTGVPNVSSGGIDFKSIDFQRSNKSPLGFAL